MATEREVKLDVDDTFVMPRLGGDGVTESEPRTLMLRAVYWDTSDLRLHAQGFGLRSRDDGSSVVWTLKGETEVQGDAVVRDERSVEAPASQVPASLAAHLPRTVRVDELAPVVTLRTRRDVIDVHGGGVRLAEVVEDHVDVVEGDAVAGSFHEVEVEQTDDRGADAVATAVRALRAAGARHAAVQSKYARALAILGRIPAADGERHLQ